MSFLNALWHTSTCRSTEDMMRAAAARADIEHVLKDKQDITKEAAAVAEAKVRDFYGDRIERLEAREKAVAEAYRFLRAVALDLKMTGTAEELRRVFIETDERGRR